MNILRILFLPIAVSAASMASAEQTFTTASNVAQFSGFMSLSQSNILTIDGRKIREVKAWNDELKTILDDENGRVTFFAVKPEASQRAMSLQVSDDAGGTYVLNLQPKDVPAEVIHISNQMAPKATSATKHAPDYQRAVKNTLLLMTDEKTDESSSVSVNKEIPLWAEAKFVLVKKFPDGDLVGEKYVLTNISNEPMNIAEQELYRAGVLAVAVENHILAPGATTNVYIVAGGAK